MRERLTVYPLSHPRVKAARDEFYRNRRSHATSRCRVTFEFLYEQFSLVHPDFEGIQVKAGVNHNSLDRLHDSYFMSLLNVASAGERRREGNTAARGRYLEGLRQALPALPCFAQIAEGAQKAGHVVEAMVQLTDKGWVNGICRKQVIVSGVACWIHPIRTTKPVLPGRTQRIARSMLSRAMLDTAPIQLFPILVPQCASRTLVIPSSELALRFLPEECPVDRKDLSIPVYSRVRTRRTSFDFWRFANRWDLIPEAK